MKKIVIFIIISFFLVATGFSQEELSAFDILDKIDQNMVFKTAYAESDMIITVKNRIITKSMISYSEGNEKVY